VPASTAPRWSRRDFPKATYKSHEYDFELVLTHHEIIPRIVHHAYAYNGTVPGPEIRVKKGDWVKVNFHNKTHDFHTIHWHGIMVPNEMDGVPLGTQYPVGFDQTFQYLWRAQPAERRMAALLVASVPALWLGGGLWGAGDLLAAAHHVQHPGSGLAAAASA